MAVKVFVGNLPFSLDDEKLKNEFSRFGVIESEKIVTENHPGRSRGYGFVEFADQTSAEAAVQGLNGQLMEERPLTVQLAKPSTT